MKFNPDAANESDSAYDGFLSYSAEYHAVAVGALVGGIFAATNDPTVPLGLWAVLTGSRKVTGHLKDAKKEVAYTALGALIGFGILHLVL